MRLAPQIMALGSTLTWLGDEVDKSHHLAYRNGMLFCLSCASHSIYKMRNLALPCRLKPLNPIDRRRLRFMLDGRSPTGVEMTSTLEHSVPDYLQGFVDEDESDFSTSTTVAACAQPEPVAIRDPLPCEGWGLS